MTFPDGEGGGAILTLEPMVDLVREQVEGRGWSLSGLQKTTSYTYEGRWEGDSTRSAYLFFHREEDEGAVSAEPSAATPTPAPDDASLDVFLDETSAGLTGNLALVVDGPRLGRLVPVAAAVDRLAGIAADAFPAEVNAPLSVRLALGHHSEPATAARVEVRFKVRLPGTAIEAGPRALGASVRSALDAFARVVANPDLTRVLRGA